MSTFVQQIRHIQRNAEAQERRMLLATIKLLEAWGEDTKLYMRQNAPWQDHTGQARYGATDDNPIYRRQPLAIGGDGLTWRAIHPRDLLDGGAIALISDAPYGVYLETNHGSRYAIIMPTVATMGPEFVRQLKEIWR